MNNSFNELNDVFDSKKESKLEMKYRQKLRKMNPKTAKFIKWFIIIFLIAFVIFSRTELFDLAVVSVRWGRPMIYKEHLQSSAIWDFRARSERYFTAYPLGGDPEEDDFCIMRENKLIIFPWDIKDGYVFVYKRDEIEAEALRIAHEVGFEEVVIGSYSIAGSTMSMENIKDISAVDLLKKQKSNIHISYCTYFSDSFTKKDVQEKFEKILKRYDEQKLDLDYIALFVYYDIDAYELEQSGINPTGKKYIYI